MERNTNPRYEKITFECEVVTPMFLGNATKELELRVPALKAALRFWWRANQNPTSIFELRNNEANIFGGQIAESRQENNSTSYVPRTIKSGILITITRKNFTKTESISLTPHHNNINCSEQYCGESWKKGKCNRANAKQKGWVGSFEFIIRFESSKISREDLVKLVTITLNLGGLGRRSRRGFGSLNLKKIDGEFYANDFEKIKEALVQHNIPGLKHYPWIKTIEMGQTKFDSDLDILIAIGEATHNNKSDVNGFAKGKKKFASPIYITVIKTQEGKFVTLTTTLEMPKKHSEDWRNLFGNNNINLNKQTDLKKAIL